MSLVLLVIGVALILATSSYSFWANSTGNFPTSFDVGVAVYLLGTAGGMLVLLAGTVAYYHWSGLRQNRRST